jgi:hypothetical protein
MLIEQIRIELGSPFYLCDPYSPWQRGTNENMSANSRPNLGAYYGVVDEEYQPHGLASRWLEVRFFGHAQAETTSAQYASIRYLLS